MPGVIGVLTGRELKADGIGNLICGWMIHSKDGSPMKMGAWRPLADETVRYVGDAVAVVVGIVELLGPALDRDRPVVDQLLPGPLLRRQLDLLQRVANRAVILIMGGMFDTQSHRHSTKR